MNIASGTTKTSMKFLRNFFCGVALATAGTIFAGSAYAGCVPQVGYTVDPNVTITSLSSSPKNISATVVTTVGGTGCTTPPTLVGGTIRLDLCMNDEVKYTGTGNIAAGAGTQSQIVTVSVPITPKVNGTYVVRRTVVANFSDGSQSSYSYDCSGNPVSLRKAATRKVATSPAATSKKKK